MKKGLLILASALALGICMFVCTRMVLTHVDRDAMPVVEGSRLPELQWLRNWLHLDDESFKKVQALHVAYLPKCEMLCERVHEANERVVELSRKQRVVDDAFASALRERGTLAGECHLALLQHIYETAACMKPEQAKQYLDQMIPQAIGDGCCAAPASHRHKAHD